MPRYLQTTERGGKTTTNKHLYSCQRGIENLSTRQQVSIVYIKGTVTGSNGEVKTYTGLTKHPIASVALMNMKLHATFYFDILGFKEKDMYYYPPKAYKMFMI